MVKEKYLMATRNAWALRECARMDFYNASTWDTMFDPRKGLTGIRTPQGWLFKPWSLTQKLMRDGLLKLGVFDPSYFQKNF